MGEFLSRNRSRRRARSYFAEPNPPALKTDPNSLAADPLVVQNNPMASNFLSEFQRSAVVERVRALALAVC